ncbi:MAG: histidine kinase [Coriobacteriales bacterium]|jgi:signal transduction histidine kinase|nr:histidine kinase [Coriobacteriales bacterium]
MRERHWYFFVLELLAASIGLCAGVAVRGVVLLTVFALVLACLLAALLLARLLKGSPKNPLRASSQHVDSKSDAGATSRNPLKTLRVFAGVFMLAACTAAWLYDPFTFLPLVGLLVFEVLAELSENRLMPAAAVLPVFLLGTVWMPTPAVMLLTALVFVLAWAGELLLARLASVYAELTGKDQRLDALEAQLSRQRSTISTIEQQGRQAERNRLAARIHDKVGHGIMGSIFMLEAAQLQFDTNPSAARASMRAATENLRESVDDIRRDLREERVATELIGLHTVTAALETFEQGHPGIKTSFDVEGAMDTVPQTLWVCLQECLVETLTNLLKHSDANRFSVSLSNRNFLFIAEFSDNGGGALAAPGALGTFAARGAPGTFGARSAPGARGALGGSVVEKGMGLSAIEERVFLSGGKCSFALSPLGFTTKLTFTLKGGTR